MKKRFLFILMTVLLALPVVSANALTVVDCGNVTDIPKKIPQLTSLAITIIQVAVPIILVIMGSIDLFKGITAEKEDEIKKGRQIFVKRLIVAAIIFFVIAITKFLVSIVDSGSKDNISDCIDCFLSGTCKNEHQKVIKESKEG